MRTKVSGISLRKPHPAEVAKARRGVFVGFLDGAAVYLSTRARSLHCICVGATGTGKTTAMELIIRQDIRLGHGTCVIDPMGALFERLVKFAASLKGIGVRLPALILLNPSGGEWVLPMNWFRKQPGDISVQVDRRVSATLRAWREHTGDTRPRLEKWLKSFYTVLIESGLTLVEAGLLLDRNQADVRNYLLSGISNAFIRSRLEQLASLRAFEFATQLESVESRLMRFLSSESLGRFLGTGQNALAFRSVRAAPCD